LYGYDTIAMNYECCLYENTATFGFLVTADGITNANKKARPATLHMTGQDSIG